MAKAKKKRAKREKKTDAQVAQDLRNSAATAQLESTKFKEEAEVLEKHGRAGLRLYKKYDALCKKSQRLHQKLVEMGIID